MIPADTDSSSERADDRELVRALQDGRRSALAALMDRHGEGLMSYLVSILNHRTQAEDAFQDTWIRVLEKIRRFDLRQPFAPWLFRIARNRAYDLLRRQRRWAWPGWRRREGEAEQPVDLAAPGDFATEFADRETVRRLLARLEPAHREALWLRFYRELSYEEIATVCGVPLGTVKSRLRRALDRLAELYRGLQEERDDVAKR
jgi:RNA polymerase sigma-70 factor, ECF subfamily